MIRSFSKHLSERILHRLNASSIQQRLRNLTLLNVAGLILLLVLSLLSSRFKDSYFDSIEKLNLQQRQIQHFNVETARLQASIQNYLNTSDEVLAKQIDMATQQLFDDLDQRQKTGGEFTESLQLLNASLQTFVSGYRELKQINQEIDSIYQTELLEPSRQAAELLALVIGSSREKKEQALLGSASAVVINDFMDSLLKMNTYYAKREITVSLSTRSSLERVAQVAPLLESLTHNELEQRALSNLQKRVHTMISGLGSLQRNYALRTQIMATKIEASQQSIAHTADALDKSHADIEATLRASYTRRLSFINTLAVVLSLVVLAISFLFGALVLRSIRRPLSGLLLTVETFSAGHFEQPVPDVGGNELGQLAGALRDFRQSALQRLQAEQALRESESRFRALSDMSSDFFWEQNEELQYTAFSGKRAGELLDSKVLSLGLRPWENPRNTGYLEEWHRHRQDILSQQPFRDFEFALEMPDGSLTYLQASGDPIFNMDGAFTGYRGTAKNISSQKAIEAEIRQLNQTLEQRVIERTAELRNTNKQLSQAMEQLVLSEKLASLGNLVAGVAHELNTPLGNALVASTALREQVREFNRLVDSGSIRKSELLSFMKLCESGCELIERANYRAANLVSNFKQVAVDQTTVQRRQFNLLQTVQEVLATMRPTLRKLRHKITLDIPPDLLLDSYPGSLDQVINNIVTNATLHAFPEGVVGEIRINALALDEGVILITVTDNGVGIPQDKQSRVFDPFYTTRLGLGGSGLGLYIAYNIVTSLLGGQIQVSSASGEGTCFNIRIPVVAPEASEKAFSSPYQLAL